MARGGKRAGAGRPKGAKNKATADETATLSELARQYAPDALRSLHRVAVFGQSEAAVVSASVAILDRAYGRPRQLELELTVREDPFAEMLRSISKRGSSAPIAHDPDGHSLPPQPARVERHDEDVER